MKQTTIMVSVLLLVAPLVFALGITPGRTTILYQPDTPLDGSFSLINTDDRGIPVHLEVIGPLQPYLTLKTKDITVPPNHAETITYRIDLPDVLPTEHLDTQIVAHDVSAEGANRGTSIAVRVSVATTVGIRFAGPAKFAPIAEAPKEGNIAVANAVIQPAGVNNIVDIALSNDGELPLSNVVAELVVYDDQQREVLRSAPASYTIDPKSTMKTRITVDASQLAAGDYRAKLIVKYGSKVVEKELTFTHTGKKIREAEAQKISRASEEKMSLSIPILMTIILLNALFWIFYKLRKRRRAGKS